MEVRIPKNYIEITAHEFNVILSELESHRKLFFDNVTEYFIERTEDIFAYVDSNNRIFVHPALLEEDSN